MDVFPEDPRWLAWSEAQLTAAAQRGALIINAVVLAEIAPRFSRVETLRASLPSRRSSSRSRRRQAFSPVMPTPTTVAPGAAARQSCLTS